MIAAQHHAFNLATSVATSTIQPLVASIIHIYCHRQGMNKSTGPGVDFADKYDKCLQIALQHTNVALCVDAFRISLYL